MYFTTQLLAVFILADVQAIKSSGTCYASNFKCIKINSSRIKIVH